MFIIRRTTLAALAGLALAAAPAAFDQSATKKELVIGATAGSNVDVLKLGIQPQLEKKGYKVRLVEFNDYVQPNLALAQGSLDVNDFQHIIYLRKFAQDQKLDLDQYLLVAAVKSAGRAQPWARDVAEAFKTPEFKAVLDQHFAGYARPSFLQ